MTAMSMRSPALALAPNGDGFWRKSLAASLAVALHGALGSLGNAALVEGAGPLRGNLAQQPGQRRVVKAFACLWRVLRAVECGAGGVVGNDLLEQCPLARGYGRHCKAMARCIHCCIEQAGPGALAVALV